MLPALCKQVLSPGHPQKTPWREAGLYLQLHPNSPWKRRTAQEEGFTCLANLASAQPWALSTTPLPAAPRRQVSSSTCPWQSQGSAQLCQAPPQEQPPSWHCRGLCTAAPAGMAQASRNEE